MNRVRTVCSRVAAAVRGLAHRPLAPAGPSGAALGRWARGPGASLAGVVVRARVRRCVGLVLWLVCMNLVRVPVSVLCVLRLPPVFLNRVRACVLPVESYHGSRARDLARRPPQREDASSQGGTLVERIKRLEQENTRRREKQALTPRVNVRSACARSPRGFQPKHWSSGVPRRAKHRRMSAKVQLYVYDLSQGLARTLSMQFLGVQLDIVPHTGIVVFGREYFYSGGLQALPKDQFARSHGIPTCEIVELGETEVPRELFEEFVDARRDDYSAAKYDLLRHNCNHFTEEATQFLLGKSIPERIRQVPEIVMRTPMGAMFAQMLEGNRFDPVQGGALGSVGSTAPAGTGAAMSAADILGALGSIVPPVPAAPATPRASEPPTPQAPVADTPRATERDGLASGAVSTVPATAMAPRRGGEPRRLSMGPLPTAPSARGATDETPATSRRPAATPLTRAPQPWVTIATPALTGVRTPGAGTPFVTPAARAPRAPFTYPSMQPLTAKDGPTAAVLANVRAALKAEAAIPEERRAAFETDLQAAFDDPNLIDTAHAAQIAAGVLALLRVWPPAKQFGLLYLTRVLAASSDAVSAALLSAKLPATLLSARAALELGAAAPVPRAARLMALALMTNLASRSSGAVALVTGSDPERASSAVASVTSPVGGVISRAAAPDSTAAAADAATDAAAAGTLDAPLAVVSLDAPGLAVVAAAAAPLPETSDAALCQMGAALAYNVSLHLHSLPTECSELRSKLVAALLGAVLDALPGLTDKEAVGRALSVLGHLWHRPKPPAGDDSAAFEGASASSSDDVAREEALALALSLDAGAALDRLQERLPELGHAALVADVKALLLE